LHSRKLRSFAEVAFQQLYSEPAFVPKRALVTEKDAQRLLVLFGQIGKGREITAIFSISLRVLGHAEFFEPVHNVLHWPPRLSSVTELLDHSDREFIRQIPSMVSGQAAPGAQ
jgi:hypothetical protein